MANTSYEALLFRAIKHGQVPAKSTYDIWLELGNEGTPQDFLEYIKGDPGTPGSAAIPVNDVTIAVDDWLSYNGIYKAFIPYEGMTADDIVNVNFHKESVQEAINSGVLGYTDTIEGGFELYSNFKPTTDLIIDYSVVASIEEIVRE